MYPRSSDDTTVWDRGRTPRHVQFRYACEGLLEAVRKACVPSERWTDDLYHEADAVWFAKHVCREAKRLGLYREPLDLDVLIQLDVEAGEALEPR